jgi:predicted glutamine amidotransferase
MCRMLGIVASEPTDFRLCLREAPRSLSSLSRDHPDGWGVAVHASGRDWDIQRNTVCAGEDAEFHSTAMGSRGETLVAHVRKRTVGPVCIENTHPFRCDPWVFAHNGTIEDLDHLRAQASPRRRAAITGTTDSELFFAYVLTQLDKANAHAAPDAADEVIAQIAGDLAEHATIGACNFLLSDGERLYAYRQGRTLFLLERGPRDAVVARRASPETGAVIETPWTRRRHGVLIASERITDEPWREIDERVLLRVGRKPVPHVKVLRQPTKAA